MSRVPSLKTFALQSTSTDVLVDNVSLLNSTFVFPQVQAPFVSDSGVTYSADSLLIGYITRNTASLINIGTITDTFESATSIINAIKYKLSALSAVTTIVNGTRFDCTLNNTSNSCINLQSSASTIVSDDTVVIRPHSMCKLQITVQDQASLGGVDSVYINVFYEVGYLSYTGPTGPTGPLGLQAKARRIL